MKRVLIISPHFPPVNAPDCQRVRMSLPYYRKYGWDPVVVAVAPGHRLDWQDPSLVESLPKDVPVHYCGALPLSLTRFFGVQNLGLRCAASLNRVVLQLLSREKFDLVFFTTTQFLVTPLGRLWHARFGIPYVIDLQDPWRSDYYERPGAPRPPGGWKYQFARLTAWIFEEKTYRDASGFISVSHHYCRDLARMYPWFGGREKIVIPFGGPQADFDLIAKTPRALPVPLDGDGCHHFVSAGSLGPGFGHALRTLFAGIRRLRDTSPAAANRLRFHFVGTSYAPNNQTLSAIPVAELYGIGDLVREIPYRIGYLDSLRLMQAADSLLILGSDDLSYSPSKIYPSYMTGRPILALAHYQSLLGDLLRSLRCANVVTLLDPRHPTSPAQEIADLLASAAGESARGAGREDAWFRENLSAEAGTRRQCEFFDRVLLNRTSSSQPHA